MDNNQIEEMAEDLLQEYGGLEAPVDVDSVAGKLGIEVKQGELDDDISGTIYIMSEEKAAVALNSKNSPKRKRFTLAHEIGHFLLHRGRGIHVDTDQMLFRREGSVSDPRETAANQFAAALLMPRVLLEKEIHDDEFDIDDLANKFNVSSQAMSYRLLNLKMIPWF
jgi:Zn-dependent peptidase ImmA (M78 family)